MCDVCCEPFNLSTRKKVLCPYCPFGACATCVEKYMLDSIEDPHCMACRKGWNREILHGILSVKFLTKTLKVRREEILFERERSLMPATQPYVETEKRVRNFISLINQARSRNGDVMRARAEMLAAEVHTLDARIERARKSYEFEKQIRCSDTDIEFWTHCIAIYSRGAGADSETARRQFVRACPFTGCAGFLSTAWKCGLCENWACPDCHEVRGLDKDGPHTCDPNNVATARLLEKDSRPCPKCASIIFKIDGCDQMFCTRCHTAFSWRRGVIEMGQIHNPHYYDYMRANGTLPRAPGDVPCGGLPNWGTIMRLLPPNSHIATIHRMHGHIQHVILARYQTDIVDDNRDLRIKFMLKDFTDDIFKKKLQQREKARQKKSDIRQVLEMYQAVTIDLLQAFTEHKRADVAMGSFTRLKDHVNEELKSISRRYTNCAIPLIQDGFTVY